MVRSILNIQESLLKNYVKAISEMTKKGDLWNLYQANGGNQNTYFDYKTGFKKDKKTL